MTILRKILWSSVGKKLITGVTGLGLFGFVVGHLLGNFTLFMGRDVFNSYAHFLENLAHGWFLIAADIGLLAFFLVHIGSAISVVRDKRRARPDRYMVAGDAGGPSQKTLASRSMIVTGLIIIPFVIWHVNMFKFGPAVSYVSHGTEMRDIYGLLVQSFKNLPITVGYVIAMILLGVHLRHGVWSAFQSLGLNSAKWMPLLRVAAIVFSVGLALGFLILPLYVFFFVEPSSPEGVIVPPGGK